MVEYWIGIAEQQTQATEQQSLRADNLAGTNEMLLANLAWQIQMYKELADTPTAERRPPTVYNIGTPVLSSTNLLAADAPAPLAGKIGTPRTSSTVLSAEGANVPLAVHSSKDGEEVVAPQCNLEDLPHVAMERLEAELAATSFTKQKPCC